MRRLGSSYRERSARQTWAVARRVLARAGVSRVTDITRMDRLGLPVYASIRPRGAMLQVHAGKGIHAIEAQIGAAMEAIEYHAAEPANSAWQQRHVTVAALDRQLGRDVAFVDLIPRLGLTVEGAQRLPSVLCENVATGKPTWLPAELVFMPFDNGDAPTVFGWSGNGLASGNSLDEATLHACLEVFERDAVAMNRVADRSRRVDESTFPARFVRLAATWRTLGIHLAVRHVPSACGLPCFEACLHEPASTDINLASGYGLHVDRRIALARAICEAAQSRLSGIHGGRHDITGFFAKYESLGETDRQQQEHALVERWFESDTTMRLDETPHDADPGATVSEVLERLLDRLVRHGFPAVIRHRFDLDLDGLVVVKVVVPRAESSELRHGRIGARLLERLGHRG